MSNTLNFVKEKSYITFLDLWLISYLYWRFAVPGVCPSPMSDYSISVMCVFMLFGDSLITKIRQKWWIPTNFLN